MHHALPRTDDRRAFLRLAGLFAGGTLLAGCGGDRADDMATQALIADAARPSPARAEDVTPGLNLALNLAYIGAQYYGHAANGTGLPADAITGTGTPGAAIGARRVAFADPTLAAHAAALAADKYAHVLALRTELGTAAAAQPAIDLSATSPAGAFTMVGRDAAGVGAGFDPYVGDPHFLIGAYLVENRVAAAYRGLIDTVGEGSAAAVLAANLAGSIYHAGLIRTLLDAHVANAGDDGVARAIAMLLASCDLGTDADDPAPAATDGLRADIVDSAGRTMAFARSGRDVVQTLCMSGGRPGGFLPDGPNGVQA